MRRVCLHAAVLSALAVAWGCGARSEIGVAEGVDAAPRAAVDAARQRDATVDALRRDSGRDAPVDHGVDRRPPPVDAGHDARHRRDGSHERHDAGRDAGHDAGHDSGRDSGVDAGIDAGFDAGCPAVYPGSMAIECSDFGAVCVYPEGACTCFGACGCGVPMGCAQFDVQCGSYYSPCDGVLDCGPCPPGQGCGAGGEVGRCAPTGDAGGCVPRTCADVPGQCGIVLDGCGGELDCGRCLHWGCNFPQTSCPSLEPEKGTACEPDLLTCQYTEWTMVCCMDMLECVDGEWSLVGTQCPE